MLRAALLATATVALMGTTALAQPANSQPSNLSNSARTAPDYDNDDQAPPPSSRPYSNQNAYPDGYQANSRAQMSAEDSRDRDMFCRRDAAARTGYTTPGQAARDEQARSSIGGTLGGAALGAIIGAGAGNAGLGAAAGAGAGLIAGTAIGSSNARDAARSVQDDYAGAYYACMHEDGGPRTASGYGDRYYGAGYDYPPPAGFYGPGYYGGYGYGYPYYGPAVSFGFGFGGGYHGGYRGGFRHR